MRGGDTLFVAGAGVDVLCTGGGGCWERVRDLENESEDGQGVHGWRLVECIWSHDLFVRLIDFLEAIYYGVVPHCCDRLLASAIIESHCFVGQANRQALDCHDVSCFTWR